MIPVLGFTPDIDETTPGCLTDVTGFVPTEKGMKAAPTAVSVGIAALAAECRGAALVRNLSGVNTLYAGTSVGMFKSATTTWTDVKAAVYALGLDDRWSFAQFGNDTLAATITETLQKATTGVFAAIAGAPKGQIVLSAYGFVILLHTNEGTFGDQTDRWWCSGFQDDTIWTPAVSTQCATGRLIEGSGPITSGAVIGDDFVVTKRRSLFHARYAGAPSVWNFTKLTGDYGCVGQEAIINIGGPLFVVGEDDIYIYDGVRPQSVASGALKRWFAQNLSKVYSFRTKVMWDRINSRVWVFFPSLSSSGTCDTAIVFGLTKPRWGKVSQSIEAPVIFQSPAITYDGGSPLVTTYDASPSVPYDSPFWITGTEAPAVFTTSHVLSTLSGAAGTSTFTTGDFGDEDYYTLLHKLWVRFLQSPTSATATGYTKDVEGDAVVTFSTESQEDGSFDLRQSARWHRVAVSTVGDCEFSAYRPRLKQEGAR
jgi:hypothetical protein